MGSTEGMGFRVQGWSPGLGLLAVGCAVYGLMSQGSGSPFDDKRVVISINEVHVGKYRLNTTP